METIKQDGDLQNQAYISLSWEGFLLLINPIYSKSKVVIEQNGLSQESSLIQQWLWNYHTHLEPWNDGTLEHWHPCLTSISKYSGLRLMDKKMKKWSQTNFGLTANYKVTDRQNLELHLSNEENVIFLVINNDSMWKVDVNMN